MPIIYHKFATNLKKKFKNNKLLSKFKIFDVFDDIPLSTYISAPLPPPPVKPLYSALAEPRSIEAISPFLCIYLTDIPLLVA